MKDLNYLQPCISYRVAIEDIAPVVKLFFVLHRLAAGLSADRKTFYLLSVACRLYSCGWTYYQGSATVSSCVV